MSKDLDMYLLIFSRLKHVNKNFADIARDLKITKSAVCQFAYGYEKSKRFDNWVKENLGLDLELASKQRKQIELGLKAFDAIGKSFEVINETDKKFAILNKSSEKFNKYI